MIPRIRDINTTYIFASSREWNRPYFNELVRNVPGHWHWASKPSDLISTLEHINPRYIFFLHWNWMVPEEVWGRYECVCFHMTDVPYGRGGSPLQNLILADHNQTMLSALKMVKEMDAGPVYIKRPLSLEGSAEEIYLRCGKLSLEIVQWMIEVSPQPTPQEGEVVVFKRRAPEQSVLPYVGSLKKVYDFIRMLDAEGYPNAFVEHGDYQISFRNARLENHQVIAEVKIKLQSNS